MDLSLRRRKSVGDQASNGRNFNGKNGADKVVHGSTPFYRSSTLSCLSAEPLLHSFEQLPETTAEDIDEMGMCAEVQQVPSPGLPPLSRRRTSSVRRFSLPQILPAPCQRTSSKIWTSPSKKRPLSEYWAAIRSQTRTKQLETAIQKNRDTLGEDATQIRSQGFSCTVPVGDDPMGGSEVEVEVDDCIAALSKVLHTHHSDWQGLRILGFGREVNAFLHDLRSRCSGIDWSAACGVIPAQASRAKSCDYLGGHSDVHEPQVLHFNLDMLADRMSQDLRGRRFDLIVSDNVLCHLKDPLGVVCLAYELLRPGGVILFIEPSHPLTGSLPYTDHRRYHMVSASGDINVVRLHQDLLPHWAKDGVHMFSSCQRGPPFRHVLALRRKIGCSGSQLRLPTALCPGGAVIAERVAAQWHGSRLRQARSGDMERSFVMPPAPSFCQWLAAH